jgi:predicted O-methyltransferase YrrM
VRDVRRTIAGTGALPPRVRSFRRRAWLTAIKAREPRGVRTTLSAADLNRLLELCRGRRRLVEVGTSSAWTALSLLIADPERTVVSYDPVAAPRRELYLSLVDEDVLSRLRLVHASGIDPAVIDASMFDLAFLDGNHDEEPTVRAFELWSERVVEGGLVVFDDYDNRTFPGVVRAVERLGLDGYQTGRLFVWTKPASG